MSERVKTHNQHVWLKTNKSKWPPHQSTKFTPLVFMYHKEEHTKVLEFVQSGGINKLNSLTGNQSVPNPLGKVLNDGRTVDLTEILAMLKQHKGPINTSYPNFVLIEGAPGTGKSILLNEIAYRWGQGKLLKSYKIVILICLRSPAVQRASSISDLLQMFYNGNTNTVEITNACSDYLNNTGGKDVVFLFDGFDELPKLQRENSLIARIIQRQVLPNCGLVVTSRPNASAHLRQQATITVDILGFTEHEKMQFIQQEFNEHPEKAQKVAEYLKNHYAVNNLCLNPFNMAVLLSLCKHAQNLPEDLPKNLTEKFTCQTIFHHLRKYEHCLKDNTDIKLDLNSLPSPYNKMLKQLCQLSLEALNDNKLVFTFDEIKAKCPDVTSSTHHGIDGLSLLLAVQNISTDHLTGNTMKYSFSHFSIQEYLAALCIASLSPDEEFEILKEKFWSDKYYNTFANYITLTKGQRPSFKCFLTGNSEVAILKKFIDTPLKCIRLFRCFYEVDNKEICERIENSEVFDQNIIDLSKARLSPIDVECLAFFLTHSMRKIWEKLDLFSCCIEDDGFQVLYHRLSDCTCDITITRLSLSYNGLTKSSAAAITDIAIKLKVKVLGIRFNGNIGEDAKLYSLLTNPSSNVEKIDISCTKVSNKLFTALGKSKMLKELWITDCNINNKSSRAIVKALKKNTSLVKLVVYSNSISRRHLKRIAKAQKCNNTIQHLLLHHP